LKLLQFDIVSLKSLIFNFRNETSLTQLSKEMFYRKYILLEDKILAQLDIFKGNNSTSESLCFLVQEFSQIWNEYQDTWSEDQWEIYDKLREMLENKDEFFPIKKNPSFQSNASENSTENSNNLCSEALMNTLDKIDDEIQQVKVEQKSDTEDKIKTRSCNPCSIF